MLAKAQEQSATHLFNVADTAIQIAERYADGKADDDDLQDARNHTSSYPAINWMLAANRICWLNDKTPASSTMCIRCLPRADWARESAIQADLLRDIAGDPFHQINIANQSGLATINSIAKAAYEHRDPITGHIDPLRLNILADALEDIGYNDDNVLFHLRGLYGCHRCEGTMIIYDPPESLNRLTCPDCNGEGIIPHPPHARGCAVLDLFL
jgi:hypothetical protein